MSEEPDTGKGHDNAPQCGKSTGTAVERWLCTAGRWAGWALSELKALFDEIWGVATGKTSDSEKRARKGPEPNTNTRLALERTFLAAERTMMAWVRTALSLISFGFTIGKFFEYVQSSRSETGIKGLRGNTISPDILGAVLVLLGIGALTVAALAHARDVRALESEGLPRRRSLSLLTAIAVALIGMFAFTVLALNL